MTKKKDLNFAGFRYPNYTQVPNELFDVLMPDLTGTELKCLLYIVRRTFGFRKESDSIATRQFVEGIVTKDGRQLDRGTGLSNKGVWSGLKGLEEKGIIEIERKQASNGDYEINLYKLRFSKLAEGGVTTLGSNPYYQKKGGLLPKVVTLTTLGSIQKKVLQKKDNSNFERGKEVVDITNSSAPSPPLPFSTGPSSENIYHLITRFSGQLLHDQEHTKSNVAQALNIWHQTELSEKEFIETLYAAREIVLKWSGNIRKLAEGKDGLKNRAPYFFQVLRNLVKED